MSQLLEVLLQQTLLHAHHLWLLNSPNASFANGYEAINAKSSRMQRAAWHILEMFSL